MLNLGAVGTLIQNLIDELLALLSQCPSVDGSKYETNPRTNQLNTRTSQPLSDSIIEDY